MRMLVAVVVVGHLSLVAVAMAAAEAGLRYNDSASVPRGLYWITGAAPEIGDYVAVCPPPTPLLIEALSRGYLAVGRCEGGYAELIKVLAAEGGDHVAITETGVRINHGLWPASAPRHADGAGRALGHASGLGHVLSPDEVLVLSERCAGGFDSRYFGPLSRGAIAGSALPVLLFRDL